MSRGDSDKYTKQMSKGASDKYTKQMTLLFKFAAWYKRSMS